MRARRPPARLLLFSLVAASLVGVVAWQARGLGHVLYHEDSLQKADVIYVLAGTRLEGLAEAGVFSLALRRIWPSSIRAYISSV